MSAAQSNPRDDTARQIFDLLRDQKATLARIDERTIRIDKQADNHESRIQQLELKDAKRSGALAAVASIAGTIAGAIGTGLTLLITWLKGGSAQ